MIVVHFLKKKVRLLNMYFYFAKISQRGGVRQGHEVKQNEHGADLRMFLH